MEKFKVIYCKAISKNGVVWHLGTFHNEDEARAYAVEHLIVACELVFTEYYQDENGNTVE